MPTHCLTCKLHHHWHRIRSLCNRLITTAENIIAPPFCTACKDALSTRTVFCAPCCGNIQPLISIELPITATKTIKVHALSSYTEPIRSLIIAKSWSDIVASKQLAELMWQMTPIATIPGDYFIPIPLHWRRRMKRGFNQTEEMAQLLASRKGTHVAHLLKRTRHTNFQSRMPFKDRHTNVNEAFALTTQLHEKFAGKHLVLIDDLMTSGATLREAARALLLLKPASITALVGARVAR